jgi:Transposase, Mutator family
VLGVHTPVQRCVRHKERNVLGHLPERDQPLVRRRLRAAWALEDHDRALDQLRVLADELARSHPGAAASLREGMEETLTVTRLGVRGQLKRTLASTNPCESMVRHEAPCERRERTDNSQPCRLRGRPRADAAVRRSWGQPRRGIACRRWEQPRRRSGRAALPDARVRASKTERQSESEAVVEAS